MPDNGEDTSHDRSIERFQEAVKRGSEVLPETISGTTADQPPLAIIPDNPAVVEEPTPGGSDEPTDTP